VKDAALRSTAIMPSFSLPTFVEPGIRAAVGQGVNALTLLPSSAHGLELCAEVVITSLPAMLAAAFAGREIADESAGG
jgi:hypothetical protein